MRPSTLSIRGSIVALVTPMHADGRVDEAALRRLVEWHIAEGTDCISVVGTTGESPTLTHEEQRAVIRTAAQQAAGRIPVLAGCGSHSTAEAIALAQQAREAGADCQLQVVPYYNKPSQDGLYRHFRAIAEATGEQLPIVLYNVPGRTVTDMHHETVLRLAELPGIIGIKDATGDLARGQWLLREVPDGFSVYSGDDLTAAALMLCGGHGNISVTANVVPHRMHALCTAALSGDAAATMAIQRRLLPLHQLLFVESNPIPVKWALARMGRCGGTLRPPLSELAAPHHSALEAALRDVSALT